MNNFDEFLNEKLINYCENQWHSFTTLTFEEQQNLEEILKLKNLNKQKRNCDKAIICVETGQIYQSIKELAEIFDRTPVTIRRYIKDELSIYGKHYKYL